MTLHFETVALSEGTVVLLDQRQLPEREAYITCKTHEQVAQAIKNMTVRGAPAIGVTAAMGLALAALNSKAADISAFKEEMRSARETLAKTRPTAVNLNWALNRIQTVIHENEASDLPTLKEAIVREAQRIKEEDIQTNRLIGEHGQKILSNGETVLTHCNAGALATAGYGTALGVIYAAVSAGKTISVIVDETRPMLQGSRLSAWELKRNNVPVTVIADNMAAALMQARQVKKIIVGADRIAANGDTANKIGTYALAIVARHHRVPFYVAAPLATIDTNTKSGRDIPIEERNPEEVTRIGEKQIAPQGVLVKNPAFDVTPAELITGIITEKGILRYPYEEKIANLLPPR